MTESDLRADADTDVPDDSANYDPDAEQDTAPTNVAPAGERPTDPATASSS